MSDEHGVHAMTTKECLFELEDDCGLGDVLGDLLDATGPRRPPACRQARWLGARGRPPRRSCRRKVLRRRTESQARAPIGDGALSAGRLRSISCTILRATASASRPATPLTVTGPRPSTAMM